MDYPASRTAQIILHGKYVGGYEQLVGTHINME